jgi:hypothetical protein
MPSKSIFCNFDNRNKLFDIWNEGAHVAMPSLIFQSQKKLTPDNCYRSKTFLLVSKIAKGSGTCDYFSRFPISSVNKN